MVKEASSARGSTGAVVPVIFSKSTGIFLRRMREGKVKPSQPRLQVASL